MDIILSSDEDFSRLVDEKPLLLVRFYAEWCGTCRLLYPSFVQLSEDEHFQDVTFVDFNIEPSTTIRTDLYIGTGPSYAIFKNGDLVEKIYSSNEEDMDILYNKMELFTNV